MQPYSEWSTEIKINDAVSEHAHNAKVHGGRSELLVRSTNIAHVFKLTKFNFIYDVCEPMELIVNA